MNCLHCASTATKQQAKHTSLGYRMFRCSDCQRTFNERKGHGVGGLTSTEGGGREVPTTLC